MSKVPKLRFPEFKGEWEEKELGEVGDVTASGDLEADYFSKELTEQHIYPIYSNAIVDEGLYGYSTHFKHLPNSITITARGTLGVAFVRQTKFTGIGRLLVVSNIVNSDASFLKENWNFLAKIPFENGGIPQLTAVKAKAIKLLYPSLEEQQKIADCLSSLDELIEARREKIASLKAYKKGLLQQLFPEKVSKSTPPPPPLIFNKLQKIRFTGFEGEWEEVKLGEITKIIKGEQKNKLSLSNTGKYYVMNGGITPSGYTNSYNTDKDTISISEGGNSCGYIQYNKEKFWSGGHCYTLHIYDNYKNKIDNFYLYQYLKAKEEYIMGLRVGSGLPNIQKITLQNVTISFPSLAEQQKIANCLLSLDEKIVAETEQVAQLQQHKKGLLQQLLV